MAWAKLSSFVEPFQIDCFIAFWPLASTTTCLIGRVGLGFGYSGFRFLPWPLMNF